jgi:OOP family OmpA-OmpF porin
MFPKLVAALGLIATPALAQSGWYMGAGIGQSHTSNDLVANRESTVVNATVTGSEFDATDTGYKLFGGYRFTPWIAVEVNYADLGQSRLTTHTLTADPPTPGTVVLDRNISGPGADLLVSAPLGPRALAFARVGVVRARTEAEASLSGAIVFTSGNPADRRRTTTVNETVTRYGFGGDWLLSQNMSLRLEWERWLKVGKAFEIGGTGTTGEADTDFYSLGLIYRF